MDTPDWDNLRKPDAASGGRYLPSAPQNETPNSEQPEPTRSHKACIAELSLRFPCPAHTDADDYRARLDLLTRDTAHLAPALLRKACDLASQTARGLPYASEILNAAAVIVEERQRVAERIGRDNGTHQGPMTRVELLAERAHEYNLDNMRKGSPLRWTDGMELFSLAAPGEKRRCQGDGTVAW